jgi:hypothetical protein
LLLSISMATPSRARTSTTEIWCFSNDHNNCLQVYSTQILPIYKNPEKMQNEGIR